MTPIELAKEHGATKGLAGKILFTEEQLEAYNRALVAPYVEMLGYVYMWIRGCCKSKKASSMVEDLIKARIAEALAAHREMFGGE